MRDLFTRVVAWLRLVPAKAAVIARSWPAKAAAAASVLTVISLEVVPLLPGSWALRVGGWVTAALATVAWVSAAVARLSPILFPEDKGILPPVTSIDPQLAESTTIRGGIP